MTECPQRSVQGELHGTWCAYVPILMLLVNRWARSHLRRHSVNDFIRLWVGEVWAGRLARLKESEALFAYPFHV